jgi:hypothetical protein
VTALFEARQGEIDFGILLAGGTALIYRPRLAGINAVQQCDMSR